MEGGAKQHLISETLKRVSEMTAGTSERLSGPLNRLNAILSLLQPLDRYRTHSAIGSATGRPYLALSRMHAQVGVLNRLVLNRLGGSNARYWRYLSGPHRAMQPRQENARKTFGENPAMLACDAKNRHVF